MEAKDREYTKDYLTPQTFEKEATMKPLEMKSKNLGDDLMVGTVADATNHIREAIKKKVPDCHPVIESLCVGAASTASTLYSAIPILMEDLSPDRQQVLDMVSELLINNSIAAVYSAAK